MCIIIDKIQQRLTPYHRVQWSSFQQKIQRLLFLVWTSVGVSGESKPEMKLFSHIYNQMMFGASDVLFWNKSNHYHTADNS